MDVKIFLLTTCYAAVSPTTPYKRSCCASRDCLCHPGAGFAGAFSSRLARRGCAAALRPALPTSTQYLTVLPDNGTHWPKGSPLGRRFSRTAAQVTAGSSSEVGMGEAVAGEVATLAPEQKQAVLTQAPAQPRQTRR